MFDKSSDRAEIDEEFLNQLRNDPEVVHGRQSTTEPFVPSIHLTAPLDELWLAGRREDHEVDPYLRGIDELQTLPKGTDAMAQQTSIRPETDEDVLEQVRNDPDVIVHYRKTTDPYVPRIRYQGPIDINWLIGRREDDEVPPHLRGIDE